VLLESIHGCKVQHDASVPRKADVVRFELPLSAHSVGPLFKIDGRVLLMFEPRRGPGYLEMADVKIVGDVACQCIVPKESDTTKKLVMMAGQLTLRNNHGLRIGRMKDLAGNGRVSNALQQDVSLGAQTKHGSNLYELEKTRGRHGRDVRTKPSLLMTFVEATMVLEFDLCPPHARLEHGAKDPSE
jgi:hypothetical protein